MDWFTLIIGLIIGFIIGRYFKLIKKILRLVRDETQIQQQGASV